MKNKISWQIPFDKDGNQMHYPDWFTVEKKDPYTFTAFLEIITYARGRSAAYWCLKDTVTNKKYTMFMTDLNKILTSKEYMVRQGIISELNPDCAPTWIFVKRGANYGICPENLK